MKYKTIKLFEKLAMITGSRCAECPSKAKEIGEVVEEHRCCDKVFCAFVTMKLPPDVKYETPNVGGIPYMGKSGCVVAPHHRPFCSGYVCPSHFDDLEFKAQYEAIIKEINEDESAPKVPAMKDRRTK